jgi:hypothetical protein
MNNVNMTSHRKLKEFVVGWLFNIMVVGTILILMIWLSKWEMPVDPEQDRLDSLKRESTKLQIY